MRRAILLALGLALLAGTAGAQLAGGSVYPPKGSSFFADGSASLPGMCFINSPTTCIYRTATPAVGISIAGTSQFLFVSGGVARVNVLSGQFDIAGDTIWARDAANTWAQKNGNADQFNRLYGANGGYWERGVNSELLTIAAAASTDTAGNLLPADAIIEAVVVRVVTVIPTAATFTVGDATTAARFATGVAVAANTTAVGLIHMQGNSTTQANGPTQAAAAKVRITPNSSPAAATGQVRIEVFFSRFVAPTS